MPVSCWLGPFSVRRITTRGSAPKFRVGRWQIVTVTGVTAQIGFYYRVDADAACAALNRAGGVLPRPIVRRRWVARPAPANAPKPRVGFALMDADTHRAIASRGGRTAAAR